MFEVSQEIYVGLFVIQLCIELQRTYLCHLPPYWMIGNGLFETVHAAAVHFQGPFVGWTVEDTGFIGHLPLIPPLPSSEKRKQDSSFKSPPVTTRKLQCSIFKISHYDARCFIRTEYAFDPDNLRSENLESC